jgi:molybdate transport system substrate-binding protein
LPGRAADVPVAVAANFAGTLAQLAPGFEAATGHRIVASAGATGKFYTQVVAGGAPYQVLLAADQHTPQRLAAQGHAVAASRFTYALGQLVLWSAQPGLVDAQGAVLASGRFRHLAIANPRTAPYGQAAMQVLAARGLAGPLTAKLVQGDSVAQTLQFITTGHADLGFVALAQVLASGRAHQGSMWRVPPALHAEIRQDAVLLNAGAGQPAALALLAYLKSPAARAVVTAQGYR